MFPTTRSRPPGARPGPGPVRRGPGAVPIALPVFATLLAVSGARAVELSAGVVGCVGGVASSGSVAEAFTGGQAISGPATGPVREIAGFWGRFVPQVSGAEDDPIATACPPVRQSWGACPNSAEDRTAVLIELSPSHRPAPVSGGNADPFGEGAIGSADRIPVRRETFDVGGRSVRVLVDRDLSPGSHRVDWGRESELGNEVGSGVYFARLRAGSYRKTTRIVMR